jgi:hypothetical protein
MVLVLSLPDENPPLLIDGKSVPFPGQDAFGSQLSSSGKGLLTERPATSSSGALSRVQ